MSDIRFCEEPPTRRGGLCTSRCIQPPVKQAVLLIRKILVKSAVGIHSAPEGRRISADFTMN